MGILREYLRDELILTQITLDDSPSAIHLLAQAAEPWSGVSVEILEKAVMVREQHGTTGVGKRVAIPHGRMKGLDDVLLVIANSKNPIDFSSEKKLVTPTCAQSDVKLGSWYLSNNVGI